MPIPSSVKRIDYTVQVGALIASPSSAQANATLLSLRVERGMDSHLGQAILRLHPFGQTLPAVGEPVTVALDGGDGPATVFTGEVSLARSTSTGLEVLAVDSLGKVARQEIEGLFEELSIGAILKEILTKTGGEPGLMEDGPTLPRHALHRGLRAIQHARGLASLGGLDLWTDGAGKVQLMAPGSGGADHSLAWGETVLRLELARALANPDGWEVCGEGAAGTMGKDKAHWLAGDLSPVSGKASITQNDGTWTAEAGSSGKSPTRWSLGLVRSAELAEAIALAQATARAARPVFGSVDLLGNPEIEPGQRVQLSGIPDGHAASALTHDPLRVRAVHHALDASSGYLTRLVL